MLSPSTNTIPTDASQIILIIDLKYTSMHIRNGTNISSKVSNEALMYCKSVSDEYDDGVKLPQIRYNPESAADISLKNSCLQLTSNHVFANSHSEATFMDKFLLPLLRTCITDTLSDYYVYSVSDAADPNIKSPKKLDYMLGVQDRKREIYFFFIELERPNKLSKYQPEDDYCKLLKQLKHSIDLQISIGISNPVSFGLLCEGFTSTFLKMKLIEEGLSSNCCS